MTILVLDLGSSSVRALLFDDQARACWRKARIATTSRPRRPAHRHSTLLSLQARVEACMDEILQHPQAREIRAVGMDTFVGNMLGVDAQGRAVTPIYTYADTRSAEDVAALAQQIDIEAAHQRTGCIHHTAYLPGRLHWLRRTEPDAVRSRSRSGST